MVSKSEEYELIPMKPLKDLQAEMKHLREELTQKTNAPKEYLNILNAVQKIENKFELTVKNLVKMTAKLEKIMQVFEDIEGEEEGEVDRLAELIDRIERLEVSNQDLSEKTEALHRSVKRKSYFKERFPKGMPVTYRRTK
jgi:cell division septum initiation protein DivIVA